MLTKAIGRAVSTIGRTKGGPLRAATITLNGCGPFKRDNEPGGFIVGWDRWGDRKQINLSTLMWRPPWL